MLLLLLVVVVLLLLKLHYSIQIAFTAAYTVSAA